MLTTANLSLVPLQNGGSGSVLGIVSAVIAIAITLVVLAGIWKTFQKAGQPGWAAIIPIYNLYVMLKIGRNAWWWVLVILFVPIVNLYGLYKMYRGVSNAFGLGIGTTLGLWFLPFIFWPLLGFGNYRHQGISR